MNKETRKYLKNKVNDINVNLDKLRSEMSIIKTRYEHVKKQYDSIQYSIDDLRKIKEKILEDIKKVGG